MTISHPTLKRGEKQWYTLTKLPNGGAATRKPSAGSSAAESSQKPWRIRNVEDEQLVIVENDKKCLYLIDQSGILHNMAFTWCAGDGRYTVQMFDLSLNQFHKP